MIHDQHCRCRFCKPANGHQLGTVIAPHSPVPPHVRRNMDRIVFAVAGLTSVLGLVAAWSAM